MELKKISNFDIYNDKELEEMHTEIHSIFLQVMLGKRDDWTISEMYWVHREIYNALIRAGGKHIAPIDALDNIEVYEQGEILQDYSYLESKRKLGKIEYSGEELGEEIQLKNVLSEFGKFKLKEPFVYIVGGLVNHGRTKGDIDILIKKSRPVDDREDVPLKFRIMRQLPKKYWHRLHFLYDDEMHGPFTNYVPLYSLVCEVNTKQVFEMSEDFANLASMSITEQAAKSRSENKIIPFRFFTQPKPVHGRTREEIYSLESIEETMLRLKQWRGQVDKGVYVEKKFDGVRVQIHKVGGKVLILSEEGKDYTSNLPTIVSELKNIKYDFIVEGEAELWLNKKHQNRADSAGLLNKKETDPNEKLMFINLYDCLWFEGKDIHVYPFAERRKSLEKINSKHVKVSESRLAKGMPSIKRLSKRFASLPGSEGAIYKLPGFVYELDGKSFNFMKFKKERSIICKAIAVHKVAKTEKTFYYHCAIEGNTFVGKTFNTRIKVNVGDKLEVVFVDLNQYTDPDTGKVWFNYWAPRVIALSHKSLTTVSQAKKLVQETSGQIGKKKVPKISKKDSEELEEVLIQDPEDYDASKLDDKVLLDDHRIVHAWASSLASGKKLRFSSGKLMTRELLQGLHRKIAQEMVKRGMEHKTPLKFGVLSELSFEKRFVLQSHYRGKSHHFDLRFERNGHLEGYTLMAQVEGEIKEPVLNVEDAKREDSDDSNFKVDLKTGELKQDKIMIATKATQPKVWLTMEGIISSAEPGDPQSKPEPGATRKYPGVFTIIDSGTYEEGARKPYYLEYFLNGKVFKGRYVVRELAAREKWKLKTPFTFFLWKPADQTPYVLSARGISKSYVPEKGRSALPSSWEKKIPKELRWWTKRSTGTKALEMIKEIRKNFLKQNELSEDKELKELSEDKELKELSEDKVQFKLKHDWWKGQFVIRGMPVEHWSVKFKTPKWPYFTLNKNPINVESGIVGIKKKGSQKLFDIEGIIPAGRALNPNKKIPMHIDDIDEGTCNIIEDSENFMHVELNGRKLKGKWVFKRTDPQSNIWMVSKSKLPEISSQMHEFGASLSHAEIRDIHFLSENSVGVSEIGHFLDRPNSTIYDWLKKVS